MNYLLIEPLQKALLFIPRTGSTATARAILTAHYPEKLTFAGWHLPVGVAEPPLQRVVPNAAMPPAGYAVAVVLRDPIERFRSGCGYAGITAAQGLQQLRDGRGREYPLFAPVAREVPRNAELFKFETQLIELAGWLGTGPILQENEAVNKPVLAEGEVSELGSLYAEDIELYTNGFAPEPEPETPVYTAERWISRQMAPNAEQYIALRTQALQDFEQKLAQANKSAPKLQAIRNWVNGIMGAYAADLQPRSDWPVIPHTFEETVQEAALILAQP